MRKIIIKRIIWTTLTTKREIFFQAKILVVRCHQLIIERILMFNNQASHKSLVLTAGILKYYKVKAEQAKI